MKELKRERGKVEEEERGKRWKEGEKWERVKEGVGVVASLFEVIPIRSTILHEPRDLVVYHLLTSPLDGLVELDSLCILFLQT